MKEGLKRLFENCHPENCHQRHLKNAGRSRHFHPHSHPRSNLGQFVRRAGAEVRGRPEKMQTAYQIETIQGWIAPCADFGRAVRFQQLGKPDLLES